MRVFKNLVRPQKRKSFGVDEVQIHKQPMKHGQLEETSRCFFSASMGRSSQKSIYIYIQKSLS